MLLRFCYRAIVCIPLILPDTAASSVQKDGTLAPAVLGIPVPTSPEVVPAPLFLTRLSEFWKNREFQDILPVACPFFPVSSESRSPVFLFSCRFLLSVPATPEFFVLFYVFLPGIPHTLPLSYQLFRSEFHVGRFHPCRNKFPVSFLPFHAYY